MRSNQEKLDAIRRKLVDNKSLEALEEHPGWLLVKDFLEGCIKSRQAALELPDTNWDDVKIIRSDLSLMRAFLAFPSLREKEVDGWTQRVAFLERKEKMHKSLEPTQPQGAQS